MAITIPDLASPSSTNLTIANVLSDVLAALGWDPDTAADVAKAYRLITAVGMRATTHRKWWWTQDTGTFTTTADTASYALRTEISQALGYVRSAQYWDSDSAARRLVSCTKGEYEIWIGQQTDSATPTNYMVTGDQTLYLFPTPDTSDKTITVNYGKKHPLISGDADDADLIVPSEWQYQVYVQGSIWLGRHDWTDPASLMQCPAFAEAMQSMAERDAEMQDSDMPERMHLGYSGHTYIWNQPVDDTGRQIIVPGLT